MILSINLLRIYFLYFTLVGSFARFIGLKIYFPMLKSNGEDLNNNQKTTASSWTFPINADVGAVTTQTH